MKDSKKYFKDINKLFPVHSYKEKKYLKDLKEQIDEYDSNSYQELFGTPIDVVIAYYESIDTEYILKKIKLKRIVITVCILILLFVASASCYEIYVVNKEREKIDNMYPIHYEEEITKDKEIIE